MKARVLFQMHFTEGENAGKKVEVMDVDYTQWEALRKVVMGKYKNQEVLKFIHQDLPIHLTRDEFLSTEGQMREIDTADLDSEAYVAHFSLDVFIRQLDELAESDISFDLDSE